MSRDAKTVTAAELRFATTAEPFRAKAKADIVVDVSTGTVVKNRLGNHTSPEGYLRQKRGKK